MTVQDVPVVGSPPAGEVEVLFSDDFATGFDSVTRWQLMRNGDFTADDGVATTSAAGLLVVPGDRNEVTGEPAFSKIAVGSVSHLKWLATTAEAFDIGGLMRFSFRAGGRSYGVSDHPYGDGVLDPDADIRLAAATLNVLDFASGVVFDFWITNTAIYPFYERIKYPGDPREYHSFASVGKPLARRPGDIHDLVITFDSPSGRATWSVDGAVVGTVEQIGAPDPAWSTVLDHGGTDEPATAHRFQLGMGLMTLLDACLPPLTSRLIDVGTVHVPAVSFRGGPHLFGQGAQLTVESVSVERSGPVPSAT